MKRKIPRRNTWIGSGSALILTVVLTSMLAIVGVLYVLTSRLDRKASSAMADSTSLDLAVDTLVARISNILVQDVPGVAGQEYQDYPGPNDPWLACLEPNDRIWRQVSDIDNIRGNRHDYINIPAYIIAEHEEIDPNISLGVLQEADADGDGVTDAKWFNSGITTGMGKPIYAAVRIIDHGAMLNVNTAHAFDVNDSRLWMIDGSNQMQIDLAYLSKRGNNGDYDTALDTLSALRMRDLLQFSEQTYIDQVVWNFNDPPFWYTPFDMSDELKLRYRFLLHRKDVLYARINDLWVNTFKIGPKLPITSTGYTLDGWLVCMGQQTDPNKLYDYRHICTTYNMDRVIDPNGRKMVNINRRPKYWQPGIGADPITQDLYNRLRETLGYQRAGQMFVNLMDFWDDDFKPSVFTPSVMDSNLTDTYIGLEPHPLISRISFQLSDTDPNNSANNAFEIELLNPFPQDISLENFQILLEPNIPAAVQVRHITFASGTIQGESHLIISNQLASLLSSETVNFPGEENCQLAVYQKSGTDNWALTTNYNISILTNVDGNDMVLDRQNTNPVWFTWDKNKTLKHYCRKDDSVDPNNPNHWDILGSTMAQVADPHILGSRMHVIDQLNLPNSFDLGPRPDPNASGLQKFNTVADIARLLRIGPSLDPNVPTVKEQLDAAVTRNGVDPPTIQEERIRLNLYDPNITRLFQYITVMDPYDYGHPNETRIKGRININTAPRFVLERLPWIDPVMAKDIVDVREGDITAQGFASIGRLIFIHSLRTLGTDGKNNPVYASGDPNIYSPDLTKDNAVDDFEERDLLFSRISNLVTVRSDVFSAYILVRIGTNGPQRRVLAVLDRSQVNSADDRVKIVAFQHVPDPR